MGAMAVLTGASQQGSASGSPSGSLTDVPGVKVGHHTMAGRPTGCTVVLTEEGAVAGVDVRGAAPGTRETDLLDPVNTVQQVHAIELAGGSAFGLDAATGAMRYLEERGIGFETRVAKVPIVPAAILFDLGVGDDPRVRPDAECGYAAARAATPGPVREGDVGVGAGATVGKMRGLRLAMKAGVGTASVRLENGLIVSALAAVNAYGDVVDPSTGRLVSGVRSEDGRQLADARQLLRQGAIMRPSVGANTTLGVVATNARLTKAQATKMAQMAQDGLARSIYPAHTPYDGETVFALATGRWSDAPDLLTIGALAADVMTTAIVRAAEQSHGLPQLPAARDLTAGKRE
ncbi:MAG: peptidase S58 family protein [Luteitalea sp.]|nr:peptidase S58 family protein [Luteitalea sp.]